MKEFIYSKVGGRQPATLLRDELFYRYVSKIWQTF